MKCKMQDNLEFMQWIKPFWEQNFPGGDYDAHHRRKAGAAKAASARTGAPALGGVRTKPAARPAAGGGAGAGARTPVTRASATPRATPDKSNAASSAKIVELNKQLSELKLTVDGLERERDFYFGKLRDIEILVQDQLDALKAERNGEPGEDPDVLKDIQAVLYSTEVMTDNCIHRKGMEVN